MRLKFEPKSYIVVNADAETRYPTLGELEQIKILAKSGAMKNVTSTSEVWRRRWGVAAAYFDYLIGAMQ